MTGVPPNTHCPHCGRLATSTPCESHPVPHEDKERGWPYGPVTNGIEEVRAEPQSLYEPLPFVEIDGRQYISTVRAGEVFDFLPRKVNPDTLRVIFGGRDDLFPDDQTD